MKLGGTMFVHDCVRQDYCFRQALDCLIAICDEVVVVDAESTDGTGEILRDYGSAIKVIDARWNPVPRKSGAWLADLGNLARSHLTSDKHFALQADEVVHPDDYPKIRVSAMSGELGILRRNNYWRDPHHRCPTNRVCGAQVIRIGPTVVPFINDAENLNPNFGIERLPCEAVIHHYGFLRKTEAVIAKSIAMEEGVWGTHNELFDRMKTEGRRPYDDYFGSQLLPAFDPHPPSMIPWLEERGYDA